MNLNALYGSAFGQNALSTVASNVTSQHMPGRVVGAFGSPHWDRSITDVLRDPSIVELLLDNLDLNHYDTSVAIRSILLSRKWKSVTLRACELPKRARRNVAAAAAAAARPAVPLVLPPTDAAGEVLSGGSGSDSPRSNSNSNSASTLDGDNDNDNDVSMDTIDADGIEGIEGIEGIAGVNNPDAVMPNATDAVDITVDMAASSTVAPMDDVTTTAPVAPSDTSPAAATRAATASTPSSSSNSNRSRQSIDPTFSAIMHQCRRFEFQEQGEISRYIAHSMDRLLRSSSCSVDTLSIRATCLSLSAAESIGNGMRGSARPKELGISNCPMEHTVLAALLLPPSSRSITAYALRTDPSADAATVAEITSTKLLGLFLRDCHLGLPELKVLARSLKHHEMLYQLWVNGEQNFNAQEAEVLLSAVEAHVELEHVELPTTAMSPDNRNRLQQALELNRGGRRLLRHHDAPVSLWPVVLQRADRIRGLSDISRASIMYIFVKELHGGSKLR